MDCAETEWLIYSCLVIIIVGTVRLQCRALMGVLYNVATLQQAVSQSRKDFSQSGVNLFVSPGGAFLIATNNDG
jgi:hypothetical protein